MKRPATFLDGRACRNSRLRSAEVACASAFAWPSVAVPESLPFWADKQQQQVEAAHCAAAGMAEHTDVSFSLWERHQASNSQQELSLRCYGFPAADSDEETEDTATSSCSGGSTTSHESTCVLQQAGTAAVDGSCRQQHVAAAGEDDSITSSRPHTAASAAFSFGCPHAGSPLLELDWFVATKVGAQ